MPFTIFDDRQVKHKVILNGIGVPAKSTLTTIVNAIDTHLLNATASPTASVIMKRDANANTRVNNLIENVTTTVTAAGTTTLLVSSSANQRFTGTTTQTVVLPNATTLVLGQSFTILNRSTGVVTVNANGGGLIQTMAAGSQTTVMVMDISTAAGIWDSAYSSTTGGGNTAIQFRDEGVALGTSGTVDELDFVGPGLTATRALNKVTVSSTITQEVFTGDTNWVCPTGVTAIEIQAERNPVSILEGYAQHAALVDAFGSYYSWGINSQGESGDGTIVDKSSPVQLVGPAIKIRSSSKSDTNIAVCDYDGNVYTWGYGPEGDLGDNIAPTLTYARSSPVIVAGPNRKIIKVYGRDKHMHGLSLTGEIYSWGNNGSGELGVGDTTNRSSPTLVVGPARFTVLYADTAQTRYAIDTNNDAYAWGLNTNGNLGDGTVVDKSSPTLVLGGIKFNQLAPTGSVRSVLGLNKAGVPYAWGINASGQLGTGDVTPRSSPVLVLGGHVFSKLIAGTAFVFGLKNDGSLYSWGQNVKGSLGTGDVTPRSSPVLVLGGLSFKEVFTSPNSLAVFGLTKAGDLYAWGNNTSGELGVGDVVARSTPTLVLGGFKFANVAISGGDFALGVTSTGQAYAWGSGNVGQLGDGTIISKSSPVLILGSINPDMGRHIERQIIPVTAGTTYNLIFTIANTIFSGYSLCSGRADKVIISY